ncbi:hypothetical protein ACFW95_30100, partial [Streptomyces sp. NPDC059474]|uniref:hypothetical protein n=1 Tax=Streptomyces sp. NPDC059474 TaxID=3346846 RepID=UPI003687FF03
MVLVEQSTEHLPTPDRASREGHDIRVVVGGTKVQAAVGSSGVVVLGVRGEDGVQVSFAGDEESVGAFGAGC